MSFSQRALMLIGLSTVGSLVRVVIGPTVWDRVLGVGLAASKITLGVNIVSLSISESYILDLALLFSILAFLVTVLRLDTFYARIVVTSKVEAMDFVTIVIDAIMLTGLSPASLNLLMILVFELPRVAVAAHAIARSGWISGFRIRTVTEGRDG